jgi:hypothetical protein
MLFPFVPGMETEHLSIESQLICFYFMDIGKNNDYFPKHHYLFCFLTTVVDLERGVF